MHDWERDSLICHIRHPLADSIDAWKRIEPALLLWIKDEADVMTRQHLMTQKFIRFFPPGTGQGVSIAILVNVFRKAIDLPDEADTELHSSREPVYHWSGNVRMCNISVDRFPSGLSGL
jgi:hypothetical protein